MKFDAKKFLALGVAAATLALTAGQASANEFDLGVSMVNGKMNNAAVQQVDVTPKIGTVGNNVIKQVAKDPIKPVDGVVKSPVQNNVDIVLAKNNVSSVLAKFRNDGNSHQNVYKPR